ncbi:hypothetical protein [Paraburkholderia diazotrophica]|uniref:Uncharacterized protein n=1 Tax=Paraburkholderia diazotrophica TaxID=667676 RepID=A0A1H7CC88_9BURK|nr:hypothetical protein [Paraburkholderia diazotrophica]SEJ87329.1 hypothetical protein SAMN05192539_102174 [Paraburkholderia diazotrophica]
MTSHLDQFSDAERYALDAIANLHDAIREATGTHTSFCAHGIEDMLDCARVFIDAMDTIYADGRLLAELGRRQTNRLSVVSPACVPGGVSEAELLAFYGDPANLAAAGVVALRECSANLRGWLRACNEMLDARERPLN